MAKYGNQNYKILTDAPITFAIWLPKTSLLEAMVISSEDESGADEFALQF